MKASVEKIQGLFEKELEHLRKQNDELIGKLTRKERLVKKLI